MINQNKMKTYLVVGLIVASLAGTSVMTDSTESDKGEEKREEAKLEVAQKKTELEQKRAELVAELSARRLELVKKFGQRMIKVHEAAIERLEKLADRIDSRISKFESEKNVNLDETEALLVAARAKIATADAYINTLPGLVDTAATGSPRTAFETVKGYFAVSRDNLKDAHSALVEVISSIKMGLGINATSTATTTP